MSRQNGYEHFRMTHHVFEGLVEYFSEMEPPWWLCGQEYLWFFEKHVLPLKVGESVDTEFRTITRIRKGSEDAQILSNRH